MGAAGDAGEAAGAWMILAQKGHRLADLCVFGPGRYEMEQLNE